jgi:type VI protein secretion system component Hcp
MQSASPRTIRPGHLITLLVVILLPLHAWADIFATFSVLTGPSAGPCEGGSIQRDFQGASSVLVIDFEVQENVLEPLNLVKPIDGCTTALLLAAIQGTTINVSIEVTDSGRGAPRVLYEIHIPAAQVISVAQEGQETQLQGGLEGQLAERITIQYSAATITFNQFDSAGNQIGSDSVSLAEGP